MTTTHDQLQRIKNRCEWQIEHTPEGEMKLSVAAWKSTIAAIDLIFKGPEYYDDVVTKIISAWEGLV